jgi:uncharacterized protein (UPF0147 family)
MKDASVPENISRARPSCIVNLDNEHLSMEMTKHINGMNYWILFILY